MRDRRIDLGLYLVLILALTLISRAWSLKAFDGALTSSPDPNVSAGTLVILLLMLVAAWRGSQFWGSILAGFHWLFGAMAVVTSFFFHGPTGVTVSAGVTRVAWQLAGAWGLINIVAGICALRVLPVQVRASATRRSPVP